MSIIVPTFREAPNLRQLCERLFAATTAADITADLLIVDDNSQDGSVELVAELARRFPVRILVRTTRRGLSSAVVAGFQEARHDCLLVMDADLQHPPEQVPQVAEPVLAGAADIAVGSRYAVGGRCPAGWSWARRLNSRGAAWLARPLTPVRDCMAGFFALHRSVLTEAGPLNPLGYKILLEVLVRARGARVVEVPIDFAQRQAGASKLSLGEQLRFLRHLLRLYCFRWPVALWGGAVLLLAVLALAAIYLSVPD